MHSAALRSMRALLAGRWAEGERAALEVLGSGERSRALDARQYYGAEMLQLRNEQSRLGELTEHYEALIDDIGPLASLARGAGLVAPPGRPSRRRARRGRAPARRRARRDSEGRELPARAGDPRPPGRRARRRRTWRPRPSRCCVPTPTCWVVLGPGPATLGPVAYSVALADLVAGRHDRAAQYFVVALEKSEAMHARPYIARSQAGLAETLRRRGGTGDADRAAALEEEALATARELDMTRLLGEAEAEAVAPS